MKPLLKQSFVGGKVGLWSGEKNQNSQENTNIISILTSILRSTESKTDAHHLYNQNGGITHEHISTIRNFTLDKYYLIEK